MQVYVVRAHTASQGTKYAVYYSYMLAASLAHQRLVASSTKCSLVSNYCSSMLRLCSSSCVLMPLRFVI
jgi:hypothetical protein